MPKYKAVPKEIRDDILRCLKEGVTVNEIYTTLKEVIMYRFFNLECFLELS